MDLLFKDRKRFATWMWIKSDLHQSDHRPPLFKEGEVWWCHAGENMGIEINGKGDTFTRPILVLKKYDKYSFFGLPLSTKLKVGSWYYPIIFKGSTQVVNLVQGRVFDYRRIKEKTGDLGIDMLQKINQTFTELHRFSIKIDPPLVAGVVGNPK